MQKVLKKLSLNFKNIFIKYGIIRAKLGKKLEDLEINQSLRWNEREKPRPTVENDPGSWTSLKVRPLTMSYIFTFK